MTGFRTLSLVLVAACTAQVQAQGDPPPPDQYGPWAVGSLVFEIHDVDRNRTLVVEAWYPVDPAHAGGAPWVYQWAWDSGPGIPSPIATDSPPVSAAGPFPLIVHSHGSTSFKEDGAPWAEALASHGFVVAAADHAGDTLGDWAAGTLDPGSVQRDRPQDISFVITRMLEKNQDSGDVFFGRVDPERIGVTGFSFGGFGALTTVSGFQDIPADTRPRAVLGVSAFTTPISNAELERITIPSLIIAGTDDVNFDTSQRGVLRIQSEQKYFALVRRAGHLSFFYLCQFFEYLIANDAAPAIVQRITDNAFDQACVAERIANDEALRLTRLYEVAFFKHFVAGDTRYAQYLTPAYAENNEPDADLYVSPSDRQITRLGLLAFGHPAVINFAGLPRGPIEPNDPQFTGFGLSSVSVTGSNPTELYDTQIRGKGLASVNGQLTVVGRDDLIDSSSNVIFTLNWARPTDRFGISMTDLDGGNPSFALNFYLNGELIGTAVTDFNSADIQYFRSNRGPFDTVTIDFIRGGPFGYGIDNITVEIACPGDLVGDNQIGLADLAIQLSNFGTPSGAGPLDGDLDADGDVDLDDLAFLLAAFGTLCAG